MTDKHENVLFTSDTRARNVVIVLLAIGIFMLKREYAGPYEELVQSYGGNFFVSFALYFVFINAPRRLKSKRLFMSLLVLAIVELFEAFNGFGITMNVYDPFDFIANAVGVGCALALDTILSQISSRNLKIE